MKEFYLLKKKKQFKVRNILTREEEEEEERNYISLNILLAKKTVAKTITAKRNTCRANESENCYISHMIERFVSSTSG